MLTGKVPFQGRSPLETMLLHASETLLPPRQLNPGLLLPLDALVERMLAKQPEDRFATYEDLLRELAHIKDLLDSKKWNSVARFGTATTSAEQTSRRSRSSQFGPWLRDLLQSVFPRQNQPPNNSTVNET